VKAPTGLAASCVILAFCRSAAAVEREHQVGVDLGGLVEDKNSPDVGATVGVHYAYGLTDAFNLTVQTSWSFIGLGKTAPSMSLPDRPSTVGAADVGLAYVFDVLTWVPYAEVMIGGYDLWGGTVGRAKVLPGVAIAGGLNYRLGRALEVGVDVQQHMLFTVLSSYPSFTEALARVEYVWGW